MSSDVDDAVEKLRSALADLDATPDRSIDRRNGAANIVAARALATIALLLAERLDDAD